MEGMAADRQSSTMVVAAAPASDDNNHLFLDILHGAPLFGRRKPTSILGSIFYCILLAGYAIFAIGATWFFHPQTELVSPLLCSCNVILLVVTGIFHQYLVYQVQKIRLQGYYVFSQKLKHVIRLPFAFIAYGTAAMLLIHTSGNPILAFCPSLQYSGYVHQYNALDSQPDYILLFNHPTDIKNPPDDRYHEGGRLSDQQMALLQHQRENIHFLNEEVDLAHLLAARDQELRTVLAEMNHLQSELSLARSLIAERDSELQHVRSTNNQYLCCYQFEDVHGLLSVFPFLDGSQHLVIYNHVLTASEPKGALIRLSLAMIHGARKFLLTNYIHLLIKNGFTNMYCSTKKLERALDAEWMSNLDLRKLATAKS
ncbi:hypothetical protein ACH5RR_006218 [Cinchona calisaya]|uniref:Transmembrane protein 192 n=1 Tax=Cinchona calisaya TaxID=153742 RepID=A0ABD3ANC9_9GENT